MTTLFNKGSLFQAFSNYGKLLFIILFAGIFTFFAGHSLAVKDAHAEEKPLFTVRGIGGGGGFFTPIFSPYNEDLYFVICDMGGMYRSENKGKTWEMLPWHKSPRRAHFNPAPIFLSKEKIVMVHDRLNLTMSIDEGKTWKTITDGPWNDEKKLNEEDKRLKHITSFLPLDSEGKSFLVGTAFGLWIGDIQKWKKISDKPITFIKKIGKEIFYIENSNILARSSDGGITWDKTPLPAPVTGFSGLISEKNETTLYLATKENKILKSVDYAKSWQLLTDECRNVIEFIFPKDQPLTIYALESFYNVKGEEPNILCSLDGGETWDKLFIMNKGQETFWREINVEKSWLQTNLHWSYYLTGFAVSPFDSDLIMTTTQGEFFISRDAGKSWQIFFAEVYPPLEGETAARNKSIGLEVTSSWGYYFDPHKEDIEYIAYTDIGFARSLDSGETWSWSATGSPWTNTFYDLALDPDVPGKIYAANSNLHDIPHFMFISHIKPSSNTHKGGVVVSTDYGKTWKVPYDRKAENALPAQVATSIVIDPNSSPESRTLYASLYGEDNEDDYAGVYVSFDDGKTWALTEGQPGGYNKHIYKLKFHPQTGDLYALITGLRGSKPNYFNIEEGGVWKSKDKGKTWEHISKGSTLNHWANAIAFHPTDPNGIYVAAASPPGIQSGGVYYTKDGGKRWWHILQDKDISRLRGIGYAYDHWMSIIVHPEKTNLIFAGGTNHGLFFSADGGRTWRWCKEFPFLNAQSMTFNPHNTDELLITTLGSGVWSTSVTELLKIYNYDYSKIK